MILMARFSGLPDWLPVPRLNILVDFEAIFKAFQDIRFIGVLRQRWEEIKKLQFNILQPA